MNDWGAWQWFFLLASEVALALVLLAMTVRLLTAIHEIHRSINSRMDELIAEARRSSIAETREVVRLEQERQGDKP